MLGCLSVDWGAVVAAGVTALTAVAATLRVSSRRAGATSRRPQPPVAPAPAIEWGDELDDELLLEDIEPLPREPGKLRRAAAELRR